MRRTCDAYSRSSEVVHVAPVTCVRLRPRMLIRITGPVMKILSLESGHLLRMSAYITFSLLSLVVLTYKFDSMNTEQTSHRLLYYVSANLN